MAKKTIIIWSVIIGILLIVGITVGVMLSKPKLSFEEFETRCTETEGNFVRPFCDSPTNPNCSKENAICECPTGLSFTYKNVKNNNEFDNGCFLD